MRLQVLTESGEKKLADLVNRLGVGRQDIIAIHKGNGSRFHVFYWGEDRDKSKQQAKPAAAPKVETAAATKT
jgi:hypothetical protein